MQQCPQQGRDCNSPGRPQHTGAKSCHHKAAEKELFKQGCGYHQRRPQQPALFGCLIHFLHKFRHHRAVQQYCQAVAGQQKQRQQCQPAQQGFAGNPVQGQVTHNACAFFQPDGQQHNAATHHQTGKQGGTQHLTAVLQGRQLMIAAIAMVEADCCKHHGDLCQYITGADHQYPETGCCQLPIRIILL